MNGKIRNSAILAVLAIFAIAAFGQPAHAQNITIGTQYDQASYIPGGSGTLTVSIINNGGNPVEIRNITVYFPWAQMVNGKWPTSGANVSYNIPGFTTIGTASSSGGNIYTWSTSFAIPSWYSGSVFGFGGGNCPGSSGPRYSTTYQGCILVGVSGNPPSFETHSFSITMALPTYTPGTLLTEYFTIATLIVLVIATLFLAMVWTNTRRTPNK